MKISSELKYAIINLAEAAQDARYFNKRALQLCEKAGIDIDDPDFIAAFAYVEGDCDTTQIFNHLESL